MSLLPDVLSVITTCKGRLEHLKRSLPAMTAINAQVVVVDYDCPDRTAEWVRTAFPAVTIVRCDNKPRFNVSDARNHGARAARGEWLCFLDADTAPQMEFFEFLESRIQSNIFLTSVPFEPEKFGALVCQKDDFHAVGGYDEAFDGWSQEDIDLYQRLELSGLRQDHFPNKYLKLQAHGDELRTRHHGTGDRWLDMRINGYYRHAKLNLIKVLGQMLPLDFRSTLYAQIRESVLRGNGEIFVDLPHVPPADIAPGVYLSRKLSFRLNLADK